MCCTWHGLVWWVGGKSGWERPLLGIGGQSNSPNSLGLGFHSQTLSVPQCPVSLSASAPALGLCIAWQAEQQWVVSLPKLPAPAVPHEDPWGDDLKSLSVPA